MSIKYSDSGFLDGADSTKKLSFDVSGVTTGTTRTITMPDANVDLSSVGTPDDNSVTLAKMAGGTDGNLITYDASGDPAYVTTGTSGQVLTSGGAGVAPTFQTAAGTTQVSFYAKASGGQSISAATYTKMTYASEIIDTHSAYDTTNSRFTPTIAGYYLFVARASVTNVATSDFYLGVFYKNGSQYTRGGNCKPSANWNALTGSTIMYMNGSSDYVEHYVLTPTALTTEGNTDWFQGVLVS